MMGLFGPLEEPGSPLAVAERPRRGRPGRAQGPGPDPAAWLFTSSPVHVPAGAAQAPVEGAAAPAAPEPTVEPVAEPSAPAAVPGIAAWDVSFAPAEAGQPEPVETMSEKPTRPASLLDASAGTHEAVRQVTLTALLCGLMAGAALLLTAAGVIARLLNPVVPALLPALLAAVTSLAAFGTSLAVLHLVAPIPNEHRPLPRTVRDYTRAALLAVGCNAAGLAGVGVAVFLGGLRGGMWIPLSAVGGLNLLGAAIGWPRVSGLRRLLNVTALPHARTRP